MAVLVTLVLISVLVYFVNLYMDLRERTLISEKALERANDEYVGKKIIIWKTIVWKKRKEHGIYFWKR